jgi:hypothetical protein
LYAGYPRADHHGGPPGVRLDSGGIAKGLFGDLLAAALYGHAAFAVDAAGDIRFGGADGLPRPVQVASPLDDSTCGPSSTACGFTPSGISHLRRLPARRTAGGVSGG